MKKIDLHIHTKLSDGVLTPKEVIDKASRNNVSVISIADHDTIDAYTDELLNYAKEKKIKIISAVEISTKTDKCGIHILGYNIDICNEDLKDELYQLRNARHTYLHDVSKKLKELGYKINVKKLDQIDTVSKAHIAQDVVENIENKDLLMKAFNHIPEKGEFIETLMNEGLPAYVEKKTISPKQAAKLIRKAGGKVVLAHPVAYSYEDHLKEEDIQRLVDEISPDGIEANYIYVDRDNHIIDDIEKWVDFTKKNHLFTTIGSDFHSSDGIRPEIGLVNTKIDDSKINTDEMIKNLLEKNEK